MMAEFLFNLLLAPLMDIYAMIFSALPSIAGSGGRVILFSLVVNLLLLPIYRQMEKNSRSGRQLKEKIASEVARMKRHFRGRERYFYIRAVYRQHRYHPISHLLGSADLFLQVLVFATVYQFLSNFPGFVGEPFGRLRDLSQPDQLLWGHNLLPILMTVINAGAVFAYVDDRARRVQALSLSALFLVLLYNSASGLVLYWTMNNLFSLVRTRLQRGWSAQPSIPVRWLNAVRLQQ